jgi:hypothetical protein
MKLCVELIIQYDCPANLVLMCSVNCASETNIDTAATKMIPFNNFGAYFLRIKICTKTTHPQRLSRYSLVDTAPCTLDSEFQFCSRFIPPQTFVPVALPINTTYVEVDFCDQLADGTYFCYAANPNPARIFGNTVLFPRSYDAPQSNVSICTQDAQCLGSRCDTHFTPAICSPKSLKHVRTAFIFAIKSRIRVLCVVVILMCFDFCLRFKTRANTTSATPSVKRRGQ